MLASALKKKRGGGGNKGSENALMQTLKSVPSSHRCEICSRTRK